MKIRIQIYLVNLKNKVKEHTMDMIPRMWCKYVTKEIDMLKENIIKKKAINVKDK